jgi:hypothetical protein
MQPEVQDWVNDAGLAGDDLTSSREPRKLISRPPKTDWTLGQAGPDGKGSLITVSLPG